jgi:hypothetical protein
MTVLATRRRARPFGLPTAWPDTWSGIRGCLCLLLIAASLVISRGALANDTMTLLLDRRADRISIYFQLPARDLPAVFGSGADALLGTDATVDIDRLYDGTFLLADDIISGTTATIGGQPAGFEGLSMMVHDPHVLPDFATPYDAELSIAVCTSPDTVRGMGLEPLRAYLGYFSWKVDGYAEVSLALPTTGRGPITVRIMEFVDFAARPERNLLVPDGGRITIGKPPVVGSKGPVLPAAIMAMAVGLGAFLYARRRLARAAVS